MPRRRSLIVALSAAVLVLAGGTVAFGAAAPRAVSCSLSDTNVLTCPIPSTTTTVTRTVTSTRVSTPAPVTSTVTSTVTAAPSTTSAPVSTTSEPTTSAPVETPTSATTPTSTTTTTSAPGVRINCAPTPSACGYPDASNTGAKGTLTLVKAGDSGPGWDTTGDTVNIRTAGTVFANKLTTSDVNVFADNVTIRNVKNTASGESLGGFAIRHGKNTLIEDVTIAPPAAAERLLVGIKDIYGDSSGTVIRRADISGTSTGIQIDQGLIEDNYIHDLRLKSGDHINGTTSNGGSTLLTIRHNTVLNSFSQTDAVSLFQDFGAQRNRVIDNNLLAGGGYTVYGGANAGKEANATGIRITNNRISRQYFPGGGSYGWLAAWNPSGAGNVLSGNVFDNDNTPATA